MLGAALEGKARLHFQAPIIGGLEEALAVGPAGDLVRQAE